LKKTEPFQAKARRHSCKGKLRDMANMDWPERLLFRMLRLARTAHIDRIILFRGPARPFSDYFVGFEKVDAVRRLFGEKTEEVLRNLQVQFMWAGGYMGVNESNGNLMVNSKYLNNGDRIDVYLDIIHELVHVKQRRQGKELFDGRYSYTERPTEVEAYDYAVQEARRLGLKDQRICQYLKTEWMSDVAFKRLAKALGVNCGS